MKKYRRLQLNSRVINLNQNSYHMAKELTFDNPVGLHIMDMNSSFVFHFSDNLENYYLNAINAKN